MATSPALQRRIEEFVASLQEEFGEVDQGDHDCLLSAIEEYGVQVGDAVATSLAQAKAADQLHLAEDKACCPGCGNPGDLKGERKRLLDSRRGKLRISEPEYFCSKCRKSFFPSNVRDRS